MTNISHMSLTDTQRAILDFIRQRIEVDGVPPSQLEIAAAFGFRQNKSANYHLKALEDAGAIERVPGQARGIRLVERRPRRRGRPEQLRLPVLGQVAAGLPIGADIGSDAEILIDRVLFSPTPDYLLRVKGDSMREDGIFDGDLVAVHRTNEARNGQVVVARIDGEITIKRLEMRTRQLRLLPRNPDFAPIEVPAGADFAIEGIYCGLVRQG